MHAGGNGLAAQRGDSGVWLGVESVEQRGAAQDSASCFTELVAGEGGAVQVIVGGVEVHALDLHGRGAASQGNGEQEAGHKTGLAEERPASHGLSRRGGGCAIRLVIDG